MIKINNRLKLIGDLVDKNDNVLDIGCDHGLLEIYLLKKKIKVVGTDNKKGPLDICKSNLKKEKLKCELRLGDGLDTYKDEDTIKLIDLTGGPSICINEELNTTKFLLYINKIEYHESNSYFLIYTNIHK